MIEKVFKNEQSMEFLSYLTTLGYRLDKYISGKGVYGNRVSVVRPRDPRLIYSPECEFKNSEFMIVEGIRPMEIRSTILANRQRAETHFTGEESLVDCLSSFSSAFLNQEDLGACAKSCYEHVGKKLLRSSETNFRKLENFLLGSMLKYFPMQFALAVAEFRQENLLTYLTQDILSADFVKKKLELFPAARDKLVLMKQRIMIKKIEKNKQREADEANTSQEAPMEQEDDRPSVQETMQLQFQV